MQIHDQASGMAVRASLHSYWAASQICCVPKFLIILFALGSANQNRIALPGCLYNNLCCSNAHLVLLNALCFYCFNIGVKGLSLNNLIKNGTLSLYASLIGLDAPFLPLRQADMCLVCIAFASWVLKSASPGADTWKAGMYIYCPVLVIPLT